MIKYNNTNNASTTLTAGISPSSTTLIVENGDILPAAPFLLTLEHFDNEKVTVREIVKCIAKAGNILTIQRGAGTCVQDDSATPKAQNNTPHSFSVGDCASIYWTSEQVQDIQNEIEKKLNIDDFQAGTYVYGATSTGTDAYSITIPGTLTSYAVGQVFRFMADVDNEGNATLNINGLGEKEILKNHDQHLQSGDIEAGQIVEVAYDGTNFQMDSQIASVISLDDISSLSYNDTTCYAGEEIHENDLIVTNGNSFNPDRTDEDLSVGGTTVNKYAIGFTSNGESTDSFSIKTSVIEGFSPDSVTVKIETDDGGKPSGTAVHTFTNGENFFKSYTNVYFLTEVQNTRPNISDIEQERTTYSFDFHQKNVRANWDGTTKKLNNSDGTSMDFSGITELGNNPTLKQITFDDKHFYFYNGSTIYCVYTPTRYSTSGASVIYTATTSYSSLYNGNIQVNNDGSFLVSRQGGGDVILSKLTTPYDVSNIESSQSIMNGSAQGGHGIFDDGHGKGCVYFFYANAKTCKYRQVDFTTFTLGQERSTDRNTDGNSYGTRVIDTNNPQAIFVSNRVFVPGLQYSPNPTVATVNESVSLTAGKYRLTIIPVVTGSVVDSVKIYDKEGEYYSECAVNDTNNVWSNVANRTPYIDSSCIKARYARKINQNKVPCGFANGDYSEFEPVSYCFKGIKKGFSGLVADTLYYSDGNGGITTTSGDYIVGKSADENTLNVGQWYSQDSANDSISIRYTTSNHYESTSFIATADEYIMINTTSINRGDVTGFGIAMPGAMWFFPLSSEKKRAYLLKKGMKYQIGYTSGNVTESNPLTIECTFVKV